MCACVMSVCVLQYRTRPRQQFVRLERSELVGSESPNFSTLSYDDELEQGNTKDSTLSVNTVPPKTRTLRVWLHERSAIQVFDGPSSGPYLESEVV